MWAGADAQKLGLVDELGTFDDAIVAAADLAKLGDDYDVDFNDREIGFGEALGLRMQAAAARIVAPLMPKVTMPALPKALAPFVAELDRLARMRDPANVYAYCLGCSFD